MAELSTHAIPEFASHQTALAILPPLALVEHANALRAAYDKSYQKWPAHINIIYPFVHPESLGAAASLVRSALGEANLDVATLRLDGAAHFTHKHSSTIYVCPESDGHLQWIRRLVLAAFHKDSTQQYHPHMTIGQAGNDELRYSLQAKASLLPAIEWPLKELAIMVRGEDNVMRVWCTIPIATEKAVDEEPTSPAPPKSASPTGSGDVQSGITYRFEPSSASWLPSSAIGNPQMVPPSLKISSYNVLVDSIYPPAWERFEILLETLLSDSARADLLVLQEVSDDFLCHLLRNNEVRRLWPYVSHAPPDQEEIGPLLSLRNLVVLSRWSFEWQMLPFERRHKGALIVKLKSIGKITDSRPFHPLVVAGIHLTCGLTDGSVAAKKSQLRTLISHLSSTYSESPWIVAGDFNLTTSRRTIDDALRTRSVSPQTVQTLGGLEQLLSEAGLADVWTVTRSQCSITSGNDDVGEGEEGATFDPSANPLAAEIVGQNLTHRPQRYDRILLKGEEVLEIAGFNMFGYPRGDEMRCGSDHWGVRATMRLVQPPVLGGAKVEGISSVIPPPGLDSATLRKFVKHHSSYPTVEDIQRRSDAFSLLVKTLKPLSTAANKIPFVIVPVGSYGLDAWNVSSDVDCLCISSISSKTFFTLAVKHLKNAAAQGIRLLRKVEAHSGTMLELSIQGIRLDLQYCAAARIADCWPSPLSLPATDTLFSLPLQTLSKLKAIRDLAHLQSTTPDLSVFQMAYRFLVIWATSRGIYAARFGFLSGTHISLMLDRVAKLLYHSNHEVTAAHLICTFFKYYADFDWARDIVEDPLTRSAPGMGRPYHRHAAEPMVVLGYHIPRVNIARAATAPTVNILAEEFKRAKILVEEGIAGVRHDWADLATRGDNGASEFLSAYKSYLRIDVQYWGSSSVKGRQLIGWVESRCPSLLIETNRKIPEVQARIWPTRFTPDGSSEKGDRHGCYLIGLAKRRGVGSNTKTESDRKLAQNKLDGVLERFSDQVRGNEKFYDAALVWIDVKHVNQSKLENLVVDNDGWGSDLEDGWDFEDDDEEEDIGDVSADEDPRAAPIMSEPSAQTEGSSRAGKKLRPATAIMNRLRWDPNLNSADYVVGYIDRFLGTRETPLDRWKIEQTDEEFIPQHRILYFKRRSDGVKVWDREARLDALSGNPS